MSKTADIEAMYQHLEDTVRGYNPSANFQQIRQAYEFAPGCCTARSCARTARPL